MDEKKRPTKPGQENLEVNQGPKGLIEQTPVSTPDNGVLPPLLSLEENDRKIERKKSTELEQFSTRLPKEFIDAFRLTCEERGYHRQYGKVVGALMALWVGGTLNIPELSNSTTKTNLRHQLKEQEVRSILEELDNSRRRGASSTYIQSLQERLAKAAKKIKLIPELETRIRKELNLV